MSLITRGLGATQLVVTAGLGIAGFVIVESGCVLEKTFELPTQFSKSIDVSDASFSIEASTIYPKNLDLDTELAKDLALVSTFMKTMESC